ncbi:hypothetical protein ACJJTC_003680 [Scirpophaga incertulas]
MYLLLFRVGDKLTSKQSTDGCLYTVTVSKKTSQTDKDEAVSCLGQKSFISIHSTDHLCQLDDIENSLNLDECNVEVLSLNEVFPSTSEESLSNDDGSPVRRRRKIKNSLKPNIDESKSGYVPTNSKSSTLSGRKEPIEGQTSGYSDFDIPKSTMYVIGSNPGEPKMCYPDPSKKISKTMKKFLRNVDKHKNDQNKLNDRTLSKLTIMRGILKDGRCVPECTGDSSVNASPDETEQEDFNPYHVDFGHHNYKKQNPDKNVSFNTQVMIIHFNGDLCVGQSVETLSKEKDQQARNSQLRKTFLTKYNEFWPTQK